MDHLVVLAAGRGTRMDPFTRTRPKVLLPVAGRPIMGHVVEEARRTGFRRVTFVVHHGADQVRAAFADPGMEAAFIDQGEAKGTGHAVACLGLDDDAVLVSGDSVLDGADLERLRDARGVAVGGREVPDARAYGLLDVRDGRVHGVTEKPGHGAGPVNAGAYRITPELVRRCTRLPPSPRGELELTDALSGLAADGDPPVYVEVPSWREAGRPWDLLDLQGHLLARQRTRIDGAVGERVDIDGPVVVEEGATVRNGTRIEGPCWIGPGAEVGPHAYLRGATSVGAQAKVGASVEVKNSILDATAKVPHLSYVGDSVLSRGCNLGAGTQIANLKLTDRAVRVHWQGKEWLDTGRRKLGALLADGAKTGVNASLHPGTVLAPGALVGAGVAAGGWIE